MSQMLKSSGAMAVATLSSRLLGMLREMAYAWFMGTGGAAWFAGISTINSFNFTAVPANTGQVYSTLSTVTDYSRNALAFNGILSTTATGGYTITQPTGTGLVLDGFSGLAGLPEIVADLLQTGRIREIRHDDLPQL